MMIGIRPCGASMMAPSTTVVGAKPSFQKLEQIIARLSFQFHGLIDTGSR